MRAARQYESVAHHQEPPALELSVQEPLRLVEGRPGLPPLLRASHLVARGPSRAALPALKAPHVLSEVMVDGARDGAASAFAAAMAMGENQQEAGAIAQVSKTLTLWVQDAMSRLEAGVPYSHGLSCPSEQLALIKARDAAEVLWAMEEALLSGAARAVIGEIWGMPKALSFTATKRLQRAAQIGKTPALLLRYGPAEEGARPASGAHERWVVTSQPSDLHGEDPDAPGPPGWHLHRFKTRLSTPSQWTAIYDADTHSLLAASDQTPSAGPEDPVGVAAPLADGSLRAR